MSRSTYAQASRELLRESLLEALRELLGERDWSSVTMSDVAASVGVSRQTVYNEFGSRNGLAQAYATQLVDKFTESVDVAVHGHVDDVDGGLRDGFTGFFALAAADPLIRSLISGEAKSDLLKLVTTDAAPLIARARPQLIETFTQSWLNLSEARAAPLSNVIARIALSYVAMPPEMGRDDVGELVAVLAPALRAQVRPR